MRTMLRYQISFLMICLVIFSCHKSNNLVSQVNVFVGTGFHGHTFPGATMPHGMVQLSPDTRITTWDGCSGYHYSDRSIMGFSHIHYSGTGAGGGGDIMLMPSVGEIQLTPGDTSDTRSGYRAAFSHNDESASPGYYSVLLENGIKVELTATLRVGFHKYTFLKSDSGNVILDLVHGINDHIDSLFLQKISDTKIAGFRHCYGGLDGNRTVYFVAEFSQPFSSYGFYKNDQSAVNATEASGKNVKAHFSFNTKKNKEVLVKVAISRVDMEGAEKNLNGELPGWNFAAIRRNAEIAWSRELSSIKVDGGTDAQRRTFYSALYHAHIHPNISMDVDHRYRSNDHNVYTSDDFDNYTTYSLWDTHRALHPLFTIIDQKRTNQYIRSFIERYRHFGNLPIMEFGGSEGFAMIGYHSLPVIADAWVKGIRDYDVQAAFEGMKKLSEGYRTGKDIYKKMGYIPYDTESQTVSKTLEYSYDDWCVSVLAKSKNESDFHLYSQKGQFYRNLYNPETGFMQPKGSDYQWFRNFDPMQPAGNYTEGNAWQYTTFVPHDLNQLIELMGGDSKFDSWLDSCFSRKNDPSKMSIADVTGLIGQYAQGNEPSHNMAYLYNYIGKPWKTQDKVFQIVNTLYNDQPDGLCGNEDAGQMSAWYVLSAMGFYPVTPGTETYAIGTPLFNQVTLHLENGKKFSIKALNVSRQNHYIQSVTFNGKEYTKSFLSHSSIMQGGELVIQLSNKPGLNWGTRMEDRPHTIGYPSAAIPQIISNDRIFEITAEVMLSCRDKNATIRYTTDGSEPSETSPVYVAPFRLTGSAVVKARGYRDGLHPSYAVSATFDKMTPVPSVKIDHPQSGLAFEYIEGYCMTVEDMKKFSPGKTGTIPTVNINAITDDRAFGYHFNGYISAATSGVYSLFLNSNDGSNLYIDGKLLVDNDGSHGAQEKWGSVALSKGYHVVQINYFQMGGAKKLVFSWKKPKGEKEEVPAGALFH